MDKNINTENTVSEQNSFTSMGLPPLLVNNLQKMGVSQPKPIQSKAIIPLLQGRDILAIAQTGSGKTFAFALPILAKIIGMGAKRKPKTVAALILAPTRELAVQIEAAVYAAAKNMHLRIGLVLGGVSRLRQMKQLAGGVDVLIATPGRLMDHVRSGNVDLSQTAFFVLDEADRMLDMGFIGDVRAIAARLAAPRQTALFSATMPKEVAGLAESLLTRPLRVETAPQGTVVAAIKETVYPVRQADKKKILPRLLAQENFRSVIVFTRTKHGADAVERFLSKAGCSVQVIHGNKSQNARQRALESFRSGEVAVLIATDIAARGIDVPGISHVINYEFPVEAESYVHRIGRTGRNGAAGEAITLYDSSAEGSRLRAIEKLTGKKLRISELPLLAAAVFPQKQKTEGKFKRSYEENHFKEGGDTAAARPKPNRNRKLRYKKKNGAEPFYDANADAVRDSRFAKAGRYEQAEMLPKSRRADKRSERDYSYAKPFSSYPGGESSVGSGKKRGNHDGGKVKKTVSSGSYSAKKDSRREIRDVYTGMEQSEMKRTMPPENQKSVKGRRFGKPTIHKSYKRIGTKSRA